MERRETRAASSQPNSKPSTFPHTWGRETTPTKKVNIQGEQVFIFKPVHSTPWAAEKVKFYTLNPQTGSLQPSLDKWICLRRAAR